jgi:hypothetical protein
VSVGLVLGAFDLIHDGFDYETSVLAEGTSRGNPVPIEVAVKSWLQDGSIVVTQGYDNREVRIRVRFRGPALVTPEEAEASLAAAEAALFAELGKPNTLTWSPPYGSAASVFVVVTSSLEPEDDDFGEVAPDGPYSTYSVRLVCEAFVRSVSEVVSPALTGGGSTTTDVDTMGSATGGSATSNGVAATVVNAAGPPTTNSATQSAVIGNYTIAMTKTISSTTSSLKYLIVDWKGTVTGNPNFISNALTAFGDGVSLTRVANAASPTAGYTRTWFFVAASSVTSLRLEWLSQVGVYPTPTPASRQMLLDNIAISDVKPGIGTARQQIRTVAVSGSARTPGALAVESATAALGDTLVYVYPSDEATTSYIPALRQFRTAGNAVTGDTSLMSGSWESIVTSGVTYTIPVAQLPTGSYLLLARLATNVGGTPTITYTARTVLNATNVGPAVTGAMTVTTVAAYQMYTLGKFSLPTLDLGPASPASVTLNLVASSACTIDEAWLFNITIGQLIQVQCGTGAGAVGGSARRLFVEPARVDTPRPTLRIGHSSDGSDAFYPTATQSWQSPQFTPSEVNVFTGTSNATDSGASLRYFPRWHTHAAS